MADVGSRTNAEAEARGKRKGRGRTGLVPLLYKLRVEGCKDEKLCERYREVYERYGSFEV